MCATLQHSINNSIINILSSYIIYKLNKNKLSNDIKIIILFSYMQA